MRRISMFLVTLMLATTLLFSMAACEEGGKAINNGNTGEPIVSPTENKLTLLTGTTNTASGESYKKIKGVKYKVSAYACDEIGIIEQDEYPLLSETLKSISSKDLSNAKKINKLFKKRAISSIDFTSSDNAGTHFSYYLRNNISRSDELCFSFIQNITSFSGGPHENTYSVSHNLDPKTGKEYKIADVITDMDSLIRKTSEALYEKYKDDIGQNFQSEGNDAKSTINAELKKSFFKKISGTSELSEDVRFYRPTWVLTGQGLSLIFDPYSIASYAMGSLRVDFTYSELAGIINDKFVTTTETYVVPAILNDGKIVFDYDHDGKYDELELVSNFISSDSDNKLIIDDITVKKGDLSITRDCGAFSIMPYAVHTKDGSDYLYICCNKFFENYILIFNITGDYLEYIGRQSGSLAFGTLTNPSIVNVSEQINLLSTYDGVKSYRIMNNGKFSTEDSYFEVKNFDKVLESIVEISLPLYEEGKSDADLKEEHTFPEGTKFNIVHTDGKNFVDLKEVDGELIGRFYVTLPEGVHISTEEQYFRDTGDAVKDVFEELYFAD